MDNKEDKVQIALGTVERCTACGRLCGIPKIERVYSTIDKNFYFICTRCLNLGYEFPIGKD